MMGFETFAACLSKVPRDVEIHFLGMCEPWLNPQCTEMLLHAHRQGFRISVSTTLVGMTPEDVDALVSVPFDAFVLHIPDTSGEMHLSVDAEYLWLLTYICRSGIQGLRYKRFGKLSSEINGIVGQLEEINWPTMNRASNLAGEGVRPNLKVQGRIHCHRKRNNVLLPNGDVVLCCNDYGLQHVLGNLRFESYENLFHGAAFRNVLAGMNDNESEILCRFCSEKCMKII
jgi:hypothetical protein